MALVENSEDSRFVALAKFAAPEDTSLARTIDAEAENGIFSGKVFDTLLQKVGDVLESPGNKTSGEIESMFTIVIDMLAAVKADEVAAKLDNVIEVLSLNHNLPETRFRILVSTYNSIDEPLPLSLRARVFVALVRFAASNKLLVSIANQLSNADAWVKEWQCSAEDIRKVYLTISEALAEEKQKALAHKFLVKYLNTYEGSESAELGEVKELAADAIVEAISLPSQFQFDTYLQLDCVKQLQKDPSRARLFELLRIFATEKLEQFLQFRSAHAEYIASLGLVADDLVVKMKLLSLCSLAAELDSLSYSAIATTLQIPEGDMMQTEVEHWVIRAIKAGIMEARIDQLSGEVHVTRCLKRVFTDAHWRTIYDRLGSWKSSLQSLYTSLARARKSSVNA
uniref:Eukaryotic translation initiation factor 3 subunit M n=2 Tax=Palpitomonas bilix TaxID=652834 RepID=A0A7S3DAJ8_9EUKA|mmetsp:Transcript_28808/g.73748  ORF Transcript_28808/g.73748 Transcript_28808/m.73748 type:complete len:397 (+) Transcript_28808:76-1266(+)